MSLTFTVKKEAAAFSKTDRPAERGVAIQTMNSDPSHSNIQ
jgi:hypothetical protein